MEKMRAQDVLVAKKLQEVHEKRMAQVNFHRKELPPFEVGAKVWYQPEKKPGTDKLEPKMKGPCLIQKRVSQHGYVVEVAPGVLREAHRSQLRPHVADLFSETPLPLFYISGKAAELDVGPDEWIVESILGHRTANGQLEFKVFWKDWDPADLSWQHWTNFFPRFNEEVVRYCQKNNISLDLAKNQLK